MRNILVILLLSCLLAACGGGTTGPEISSLEKAWNAFEGGQYVSAKEIFSAISDSALIAQAQSGIGWCQGELGNYEAAITAFQQSIVSDSAWADSYAGMALAYEARGISVSDTTFYGSAIRNAETLLAYNSYYSFSHDTKINARMMKLLIAWCAAHLGDLTKAQSYLDAVLPGNGLDADDADTWRVNGTVYDSYKQALIQYIGWLRQS